MPTGLQWAPAPAQIGALSQCADCCRLTCCLQHTTAWERARRPSSSSRSGPLMFGCGYPSVNSAIAQSFGGTMRGSAMRRRRGPDERSLPRLPRVSAQSDAGTDMGHRLDDFGAFTRFCGTCGWPVPLVRGAYSHETLAALRIPPGGAVPDVPRQCSDGDFGDDRGLLTSHPPDHHRLRVARTCEGADGALARVPSDDVRLAPQARVSEAALRSTTAALARGLAPVAFRGAFLC